METEELVNHITKTLKASRETWEVALEKDTNERIVDYAKIISMLEANLRLLRQEIIDIDNDIRD